MQSIKADGSQRRNSSGQRRRDNKSPEAAGSKMQQTTRDIKADAAELNAIAAAAADAIRASTDAAEANAIAAAANDATTKSRRSRR
jgi:hypothetical protein